MAGRAPELPAVAVWGKHRGEDGAAEAAQAISLWPYYASSGGLVLIALAIGQRLDWLSIARVVAIATPFFGPMPPAGEEAVRASH